MSDSKKKLPAPKSAKKDESIAQEADRDLRMTFTEHLGELRTRIIRSGIAIVVMFFVCFAFSDEIFLIVTRPLQPLKDAGIVTIEAPDDSAGAASTTSNPGSEADTGEDAEDPPEAEATSQTDIKTDELDWAAFNIVEGIMVKIKLSAFAAILLTLPFLVYQLCAFVFPGLKPNERRAVKILLSGCTILGSAGTALAYFGVFPIVLRYMTQWLPPGVGITLRMSENVSIILKAYLGFAIAFQFPMIVLVLVYLDLLTPATLRSYRKVAIVGMAVVAAMFTPPDPGTMLIMLIPLMLLYEGSIWISYLVVRKRKSTASTA